MIHDKLSRMIEEEDMVILESGNCNQKNLK